MYNAHRRRRSTNGRWGLCECLSAYSSPDDTPQIQRNTPVQYSSRKSVTFRSSLTGLSIFFFFHEARSIYNTNCMLSSISALLVP